ncbi:hypothetical protein Y032_0024g940 [Ancylostoma ceylanicum]|uniref:Tetraspanin n=1 Tax=Ancylostoma ceylanicum TaxID=53326 RepID=A0A016UWM2_9BILA|nr:hypothetical protein Y032_0024g940 [Ancylostoma ceylanicum]
MLVSSSTTPLLTAVTSTPEKKQPLVLIRSHPKVYIAICYQLAEFMLAAGIIICTLYVRPQPLRYMARRIEELRGDVVFIDKLSSNVDASTRWSDLVPFTGGVLMTAINVVLIHQCFKYGINIGSNLCGIGAVIAISVLLLPGSSLLFLDASRYPNDTAGASQDNIHLFMHVMKVAIDEEDPILNRIVHSIHEKLECCGFHSVSDYYSEGQIDYPPPLQGNQPWQYTFRLSNRWVHKCSNETTELHNATYVCYAPKFCCFTNDKDVRGGGACPPMKWDGVSRLVPSRKMYRQPCAWRFARDFRNKMLNVMIISVMNSLTAITNALHLLRWRSRNKPPPSTTAKESN